MTPLCPMHTIAAFAAEASHAATADAFGIIANVCKDEAAKPNMVDAFRKLLTATNDACRTGTVHCSA